MKNLDNQELGTITRELYVDAPPAVVFDVISSPDHVAEWWSDTATYVAVPSSTGQITFGDPQAGGHVTTLTVLEVEPPTTFSFRWTHGRDEQPDASNSLLVIFELAASGAGTLVRFVETGFREAARNAAQADETFLDHANGWNHFLPRLIARSESLVNRA